MMTITQSDSVINRLKELKETLLRLCSNEKWHDIFRMANKAIIIANLPYPVKISDKSFKLQREHITTGIMACSKRS